ncbi:MAG: NAD(P)H-binding protein [Pseudomonadota bacterium]
MQKILVMGGSSGIGLATVNAALNAGFSVRMFSRHADTSPLTHPRLERVAGDALSSAAVTDALEGVDAVVQSLGVPFNLRLFTGPIELFSTATETLLPAMQQQGATRLLAVTGFGAGTSQAAIHPLQRAGFNLVFGRAYADKSRQEEMIVNSALDWTIVRPGVLTNGSARSSYQALLTPDTWRNGIISRASVADFIVSSLQDPQWRHKSPVLIN